MVHEPTDEVQLVGSVKAPASLKPTATDAPGANWPFQSVVAAVNLPLARVPFAFHISIALPVHGMDTDHADRRVRPVLVITKSIVRPVPQSDDTETVTPRAEVPVGVLAVGVADGVAVGVAVGVGFGATVPSNAAMNAFAKAH